jgi:hypothetical protein
VNRWFSAESRLNVGDDVLDKAASIEPNRWVKSMGDLRLTLIDSDYETINTAMDFLLDRGIVKSKFDYRKFVDFKPLDAALSGQNLIGLYNQIRPTGASPN